MALKGETPSADTPSFANVLFSFKGRINRSVFWLRGAVPIILIIVIAEGGLHFAGGALLEGAPYPKGRIFPSGLLPSVNSEFREDGDKVIGKVAADTGPAEVELEMTAAKTTERIAKTVIVGVRTLRVTAARKVSGEYTTYDVNFDWDNYPAEIEKPATIGQMVFLGVQFSVLLLFLWMLFAIAVKRYHDHDSSGWWSVLGLLPILGQLGLLISLGMLKGKEGDNRFGPDPLQAESGT